MKKIVVLDTSVFFHNPEVLFGFQDEEIVVPLKVLELLAGFKKQKGICGDNTRLAIRIFYSLGDIDGTEEMIPLPTGGHLRVMTGGVVDKSLPHPKSEILQVAQQVQKSAEDGVSVVVVSYDAAIKLEGKTYGLAVEPFRPQQVQRLTAGSIDLHGTLFEGVRELLLPTSVLNELQHDNSALRCNDELYDLVISEAVKPVPNEFLLLINEENHDQTLLTRVDPLRPEKLCHVVAPHIVAKAENKVLLPTMVHEDAQIMAVELLMDDNVPVVTLVGQTAPLELKTALLVGIEQAWNNEKYDRLHYIRPVAPMDPTTSDDAAFRDLEACIGDIHDELRKKSNGKKARIVTEKEDEEAEDSFAEWLEKGVISKEALRHVNGQVFEKTYLIIDQCQNMTPFGAKCLMKRAGAGTKVVLIGDLNKVENAFLDASTSACAYVVDKLEPSPQHGHVTFGKMESPALAQLVEEFL